MQEVEKYIASEGKEGISRLIITCPPRHGKSLSVSVQFPAWFLGRNPDKRVVIACCTADLAEKWSGQVRTLMERDEYASIFGKTSVMESPVEVDSENRKIHSWEIKDHLGGMYAIGVGGAVVGRGSHLMVIDDPFSGHEEANSPTIREKIKNWFTSEARTRLQKGGAIVIMHQRWHEDDLVGWLLETQGDRWEIVNLPAIAEEDDQMKRVPGEPLWPEMFDLKALEELKAEVGSKNWTAEFQQRPTSAEGEVFNRDWFTYGKFPHKEDISKCFQVWDTALTEKSEGDFSACATFFVTRDGLFLADMYRGHLGLPKLKDMMRQKYQQWNEVFRVSRIYVENKASGLSVIQSLKKETHLPLVALEPMMTEFGKDKTSRAQASAGYVEAGRVVFKEMAPWLPDFEQELLMFPRGRNDDMVDAFVYGIIIQQGGGKAPRKALNDLYKRLKSAGVDRHSELLGSW